MRREGSIGLAGRIADASDGTIGDMAKLTALECNHTAAECELARMWPRYEDGRPVRAGDLVTYADTGLTAKVQDILIGSACWELLGQGRRSLGQVGKFGEPVKRPPLLASDGQPIEVGQVLYGGDGRAWEVYHLDRAAKHPVFGREPGNPGAAREMKPEWLTHEQPDSWERIAEDIRAINGDAYAHSGTADLEPIAERVEKLAGGAR